MAKVDIDLVAHVAQAKLNPSSKELDAFLQELRERVEAQKSEKEPAVKKQFVFVPMPMESVLDTAFDDAKTPEERLASTAAAIDKSQSGWVVQVPESDDLRSFWKRVDRAIYDYNNSPRGRKVITTRLADAFEFIPARYWRAYDIWVKTKEPCAKLTPPWRAKWGIVNQEKEDKE